MRPHQSWVDRHKTWRAQLPVKDKLQYLREVQGLALQRAARWAEAGSKAKGLKTASPLVGDDGSAGRIRESRGSRRRSKR
ncbi:MAG: hypothetical protein ABWZ26_05105 [Candidatus Nanopelagicales bacterium]